MEPVLPLGERAFAEQEPPTTRVIIGVKTPEETLHQALPQSPSHLPAPPHYKENVLIKARMGGADEVH